MATQTPAGPAAGVVEVEAVETLAAADPFARAQHARAAQHAVSANDTVSPQLQSEIATLAARWGEKLIQLGGGDPDLETPPHIRAAALAAIESGGTHYTPHSGIPELRSAIASYLQTSHRLEYDATEVVVTAGVQEALMVCFMALVGAGDEVLCPIPTYNVYVKQASLLGAVVVDVPCGPEDDFIMTREAVRAQLTPRSKVLVHMSPNNPTGVVTPPEVLAELAALAIEHDLIVLSDEIYADQMYDGHKHVSIATLPGMRERTVVLNGVSKAYSMTGWRVGFLAAPAAFAERCGQLAGTLSLSVSAPSQHAAIAAYTGDQQVVADYVQVYAKRREYMLRRLHKLGFTTYGGQGGYMVWVDIASGAGGRSAAEFQRGLLRQAPISTGNGGSWSDLTGRYARFSFLQPMQVLEQAMDAIEAYTLSLRGGSRL